MTKREFLDTVFALAPNEANKIMDAFDEYVESNELHSDTISRAKAIDALDEQIKQCDKSLSSFDISMKDEYAVKVERASLVAFRETLEYLPSAQPKTGKWALQSDDYHEYYECDQCGMAVGLDDVRNFCPNCGAEMEVTT